MTEGAWIEKLREEGYTDVRACPIPPNEDLPAHTHDEHTVHVILEGELVIEGREGIMRYQSGDRIEFPAGTTHVARGATDTGRMIVGVRSAY